MEEIVSTRKLRQYVLQVGPSHFLKFIRDPGMRFLDVNDSAQVYGCSHYHRITIDPALANERAIAAYKKVGFKPVGVMRRYELARDGEWRDALLMDLLADELT